MASGSKSTTSVNSADDTSCGFDQCVLQSPPSAAEFVQHKNVSSDKVSQYTLDFARSLRSKLIPSDKRVLQHNYKIPPLVRLHFYDVLNILICRSHVKKVSCDRMILVIVSNNLSIAYHFISLFMISRTLYEVLGTFGVSPRDN